MNYLQPKTNIKFNMIYLLIEEIRRGSLKHYIANITIHHKTVLITEAASAKSLVAFFIFEISSFYQSYYHCTNLFLIFFVWQIEGNGDNDDDDDDDDDDDHDDDEHFVMNNN